jgi:hypothetical protein
VGEAGNELKQADILHQSHQFCNLLKASELNDDRAPQAKGVESHTPQFVHKG